MTVYTIRIYHDRHARIDRSQVKTNIYDGGNRYGRLGDKNRTINCVWATNSTEIFGSFFILRMCCEHIGADTI